MAHKALAVAFGIITAASSVSAQEPDSSERAAPPGTAETRYCLRVELTGSLNEAVRCWTRAEWAEQGVDVDKEWAREGVRVIE